MRKVAKMRAATWMGVCGALVLIGVVGSLAQQEDAASLLQGMLDAVDAEEPATVEGVVPEPARQEPFLLDDWEPRPLSDFIRDQKGAAASTQATSGEQVSEDEKGAGVELVAGEQEAVASEAAVAVQFEEEAVAEVDPLAEVMEAVKAASNETAVVEDHSPAEEVEAFAELAATVDEMAADVAELTELEAPTDALIMDEYEDAEVDSSGQLISVRLNKVGLEEAITLFAQLSGANIIVPELSEAAQISVNLKDVEWRPALQSILDSYNYELYQKVPGSNVYSVRRRPAGAPEPQVVETFKLQYATVPNAAKLVRELLPENAKVSEFASRNMLVVKSTESAINEIRAVLESIDKVRQQVFIESKFMELNDRAQQDLGIDWKVLQAYSAGTVGKTEQSFMSNDSRTETGNTFTDASGQRYEEAAGYIDRGQRNPGSGLFTLEGVTPTAQNVTTKTTAEILTSVLSADEFRLVLSALQENRGANVVSNPKVIVANEEKANISIVRKEPNLKQERREALNDNPDSVTYVLDPNREFFEYGIKLDVTPSINTSSNITVMINPSLTRFVRNKIAGSTTYPVIDEKSIQTVFSLASGQTAAIGGLTQATESQEERKVPVLGSIPFLGRLFSWKQTVHDQDETIIFVTVGLANTQEINADTGLPGDAELARRQVIQDRNRRVLRDRGREYYQAGEEDKLQDMMKVMQRKEQERLDRRERAGQRDAGEGVTLTEEERALISIK
jgi:type II secretory pathway component GspD/PulD (secretin)